LPTVFVRLTGCPLRCQYCDTAYAFSGGEMTAIAAILDQVRTFGARYVTVTGGEPLAQPNCIELLTQLCDDGMQVSLETSGALDISQVDERVSIVLDLKTPASGESSRNLYTNIPLLAAKDQVKFVICDRQDFQWASFKVQEFNLLQRVGDVLFSPTVGQQDPTELAEWILQERLPVRFQMQLHKVLWGDKPGV
jgi:7-carboxy-7-deazaguanine synthase